MTAKNNQEQRVQQILWEALKLSGEARAAYLGEACGADMELRREVESLIDAEGQAGTFLFTRRDESGCLVPLAEKAGDEIGRYKLLEKIGEGGFGVVWMAEQEEPVRRRVALKIIKLGMDTQEVVARFEAERQALAMMDHPNIARVFDGGATATGRPYFVMELVKGVPLTKYCDANKLATPERLGLFIQACQAIQHAHQKGVIHRDLKPSNILVTVQDDKPVPKVIDFGVAKATQARLTEKTVFTRFNQWIGTPAYMSPEQAGLGSLDVDTRSDIYSLGVLLYELLTGRTPFDTESLLASGHDAVMRIIREEEPPKPSTRLSTLAEEELKVVASRRAAEPASLGRLVRGDLDWVVMKCLEKDRSRRYETASALAQDLAHFLVEEPVSAAAPAVGYRLRKFARRNRLALSTVALVMLLVLVGASLSIWQAVRATRFAREATRQRQVAMAEVARATRLATESEEARRRADRETASAAAINEFLQKDLLARAVPRAEAEEKTEPDLKVRTLLDRASEKIAGRFTNQPLVEASLRATIASAYHELGLYATQEVHARWAAEVYGRELGETNEAALRMLAAWGDSERHLGRTTEALRRLEHVYGIEEQVLGSTHTNTLRTMNLLGVAYAGADQFDRGRALLQEALRRAEESLPRESPVVRELLNNLGILLAQDGQWAAAEQTQRRHLALTRELAATPNLETLGSLFHLARVLMFERRFSEAESLLREAVALSDQLGRSKEEDGTLLENLGAALAAQKKSSDAEAVLREALALKRERGGPESAGVVQTLARLAGMLHDGGRNAEAEPLLYEALGILKRQPAIQDAESFTACVALMLVLDAQGKHEETEAAMRDIRELVQQRPATAPGVSMAKAVLGATLGKQGRLAEGEALLLGDWQTATWMILTEEQGRQFFALRPPTPEQALQKLTRLIDAGSGPLQQLSLLARAAMHARLGRSKEAAADLARGFAQDQALLCLPLVPLWMDGGGISGYEQYARKLWDRYNRSPAHLMGPFKYTPGKGWERSDRPGGDPATGAGVALALALYPQAQSYKEIDTLAERAVQRGTNHASLPRFQMVLGLAKYRLGRLESAAEWARRSLAGTNLEPATVAMANAVLAMTAQRLHQNAEAGEALELAQDLLRTNLAPATDGCVDLGENWPDWLAAKVLVKEAASPGSDSAGVQANEAATNLINLNPLANPAVRLTNFVASSLAPEDSAKRGPLRDETTRELKSTGLFSQSRGDPVYLPAGIAAIVNDRLILDSEVWKSLSPAEERLLRYERTNDPSVVERKLKKDALARIVERELILTEAMEAGRQITEEHLNEFVRSRIETAFRGDSNVFLKTLAARGMTLDQFREQHRRADLVDTARQQKLDAIPAPTPEQIEQYYHSHEKEYRVDESVNLGLITIKKDPSNRVAGVESPRKFAEDVRARIVGGTEFAHVARLYSQDDQAGKGGDRGWMELKDLRKELADAASSLKPGGLSEVIETDQACFILRVTDRRPAAVKGLADVRADIVRTLQAEQRSAALAQWLERLRSQTFIRYLEDSGGIARVPEKVVRIEIRPIGVSTVSDAVIRSHLQVREGELVTQANVDHDIRALYGTGDFYKVLVVSEAVAGGIKVVYVVQERPILAGIQFSGSTNLPGSVLLQSLVSKAGQRMDECKLFKDEREIQRQYQRAGYPLPRVKSALVIEEKAGRARVTFEVTEALRSSSKTD